MTLSKVIIPVVLVIAAIISDPQFFSLVGVIASTRRKMIQCSGVFDSAFINEK